MDVIEGRGPAPALVMSLVMRLPDTSLTVALANGGRDHFGWGMDRYLAAETYDAINQNTRATGSWKNGKAPKIPEFPRPKVRSKEAKKDKKPISVKDIFQKFSPSGR